MLEVMSNQWLALGREGTSDYSDLRPIGTPQSISVHVRWKLNLRIKLEVHVLEVMHFSDAMPPMSG